MATANIESAEGLSLGEKQRYERFRKLRKQQEKAANRRVTKLDFLFALAVIVGFRKAVKHFGLSVHRVLLHAGAVLLGYSLYRGRHPKRIMPLTDADYPVWPIFGQVLHSEF